MVKLLWCFVVAVPVDWSRCAMLEGPDGQLGEMKQGGRKSSWQSPGATDASSEVIPHIKQDSMETRSVLVY